MSFIHPRLRPQFETLSSKVKSAILKRNCKLYTQSDLDTCLRDLSEKYGPTC